MMRASWLTAALSVLAVSSCGTTDTRDATAELRQVERDWSTALKQRDAEFFRRTLADDYEYIAGNGRSLGKDEYIESVNSRDISYDSIDSDEMTVRTYGETAVVTARFTLKLTTQSGHRNIKLRTTDVFARRGAQWVAVSGHATMIGDQGTR